MIARYRPQGPLAWVTGRFNVEKWAVVGCLGAEERSTVAISLLNRLNMLKPSRLLRVNDHDDQRFASGVRKAIDERTKEVRSFSHVDVTECELMSDVAELLPLAEEIASLGADIILDISSLPKRFFFYLLRTLVNSRTVNNLVVCITSPVQYGDVLSASGGRWDFLPGFDFRGSNSTNPMLIVGVGYQHLNLLQVAEENPRPVRLLFPFPSKPPGFIKNWEFVRQIATEKKLGLKPSDIVRVHPQGASNVFDILNGQCADHAGEVWLAPFGTKAMSLGMALFAIAAECVMSVSVGYTQPLAYSATYTTGVEKSADGEAVISSFVVKCGGKCLYVL